MRSPILGGEFFGSQRPPPVALQMMLERRKGYASNSPKEGLGGSRSEGAVIMTEGKGNCLVLSWDELRLTRIPLAKRVDCSTGEAQMEDVGDGEAVEDADIVNKGVDGLVSGVRGEP